MILAGDRNIGTMSTSGAASAGSAGVTPVTGGVFTGGKKWAGFTL